MKMYYCAKDGVIVNTIVLDENDLDLINSIKNDNGYDEVAELTKNISIGQSLSDLEIAEDINTNPDVDLTTTHEEVKETTSVDLPDSEEIPNLTLL